jgi:hypothetical protein
MHATTLYSCYFNPIAQLWCFGFKRLVHGIHWQPLLIATAIFAMVLILAILIEYVSNIAQRSSARSHNGAPRSVLVSYMGRCKSSDTTGHTVIGEDMCCICDRKRKTVFRCRNIADNVCLGCVVQWTIMNPNGSNPWPCCRPSPGSESSE